MFSAPVAKIRIFWENTQSGLWFIPSLLIIFTAMLSFGLLSLDHRYQAYTSSHLPWLFSGSPSAARSVLSTIAGAVITVISIAFSLTIVALQQASSQFTPRVMRNFTDDKGNQLVLGVYVSTFLYSLLVLRGVRDPAESSGVGFVPAISTTMALALVVLCVGLLIYFISHIATSLQAMTIINRVHSELDQQIDALYPESYALAPKKDPKALREPPISAQSKVDKLVVRARKAGFIARISEDSFAELHFTNDSRLVILPRVGDFVANDEVLAYLTGYAKLDDERRNIISAAIIIDNQRSIRQDPLFAIRQMVDIALKALSPGINDPTTASYCIHYLGDSLGRLAQRQLPSSIATYQNSKAHVYFNKANWADFLKASFSQIQHESRNNLAVTKVLLETFQRIIVVLPSKDRARDIKPFLETASNYLKAETIWSPQHDELQLLLNDSQRALRRV